MTSSASAGPSDNLVDPPSVEAKRALQQRLASAKQTLSKLGVKKKNTNFSVAYDSLIHETERLRKVLKHPKCNPIEEIARLEENLKYSMSEQPFFSRPGVHRLAYRSTLDGKRHEFVVYVPPHYLAPQAVKHDFPLIVMLHGMNSSPLRDLGRLFGLPDDALREAHLTCSRPALKGPETLVVAPSGFGDALYRLMGEVDVHHVVRLMQQLYRVDARRITITGLSMGGTGAVEIALQHPDLYAGVLALCGYYDRFQDRQTLGHPLLFWEKHLMTVHSPLAWTANGREIPLTLIHGTQDGPERATRLESRYGSLGYKAKLELYARGHDVWIPGYKDGRAFDILGGFRQGNIPKRVTFTTGRPRIRQAYWVSIERFLDHRSWAEVNAEIKTDNKLDITTRNIGALHLEVPASYIRLSSSLKVTIDETHLVLERKRQGRKTNHRSIDLIRSPDNKSWHISPTKPIISQLPLSKRPGLSGPIEDIYYDPILVVYGTQNGQADLLRLVAQKISRYNRRVTIQYPVLRDDQYRPAMARNYSIILVGTETDNRVLARLGPQLPLRVREREVQMGSTHYERPHLGVTFIYPNPDAPQHYLRVIGGTTANSYKLVEKLPIYLPDYVVFDEGMDPPKPLPILGESRSLVAGGFFDEHWLLSEQPLSVSENNQ